MKSKIACTLYEQLWVFSADYYIIYKYTSFCGLGVKYFEIETADPTLKIILTANKCATLHLLLCNNLLAIQICLVCLFHIVFCKLVIIVAGGCKLCLYVACCKIG